MDLRETNDAFNKLASDVRAEMAELAHQREMLDDVVKSCIQACPEQSSWKCESPAVFVRHLLSMRDAEIAKLREERDIHLASIAEHSKQLAAARAALDGEREACARLLFAAETISRCESALSTNAERGRLRMSAVVRIQNDKEEAMSEIRQILARRVDHAAALEKGGAS